MSITECECHPYKHEKECHGTTTTTLEKKTVAGINSPSNVRLIIGYVRKVIDSYKIVVSCMHEIKQLDLGESTRIPNISEFVTENIVLCFLRLAYDNIRFCRGDPRHKNGGGDILAYVHDREEPFVIEVKAFASVGPSSFGPTTYWDMLYFVDCTLLVSEGRIRIYECRLSSLSEEWQSLKMNRHESFEDHCHDKRRPRLTHAAILKQLPGHFQIVYDGSLDSMLDALVKTLPVE